MMDAKFENEQWFDIEIYNNDNENSSETIEKNKHPLLDTWTLWYDDPSGKKSSDWKSSLHKVYQFSDGK